MGIENQMSRFQRRRILKINQKTQTHDQDFTGAEPAPIPTETFNSTSGNICWTSVPADVHGRPADVSP